MHRLLRPLVRARRAPPCGLLSHNLGVTCFRRTLAGPAAAGGGVDPRMALVGMVGTAVVGVGIGLLVPDALVGGGVAEKAAEKGARLKERMTSVKGQDRRRSTVYESVDDIAEEIERPAMVHDATRAEVEERYDFQTCLASGGTGSVWRAIDRRTGDAVAIKVIDKKQLPSSRLNMEVYAMQRCAGHPHIVQLLDAWDVAPHPEQPAGEWGASATGGEWLLVMELASGGEMFERLVRKGAYSEAVASELMRQISSAIYHMHSCGVCHRDIKPENLVLMDDSDAPHIKLIDFGAAVVLDEGEAVISGGKVGTWTYWAPEQVDKGIAYDQAVDLWSLGVVLYIMLSGRHPFERSGRAPEEVLQAIYDADYSFDAEAWNSVSGRAQRLVTSLLEPQPAARLTAAQLINQSWVRGERVPERPLPDTVERLRAFKTASTAIHGSLLLAVMLHQEKVRAALDGDDGESRTSALQRTISASEGVGLAKGRRDAEAFDVIGAAYKLFDPTNKGYIAADDLVRVCKECGFELSTRDVENMLSVLAPSSPMTGAASAHGAPPSDPSRAISYDKFSTMMQQSFRKRYAQGASIFKQGDAVRDFYIIMSGEVSVQVADTDPSGASRGAGGLTRRAQPPKEVTRLGPGDFFGETGLLEGRGERNTSVVCASPVEVLVIDKSMFLQLNESQGSTLTERMRERAAKRQRTRLKRAIEMMQGTPLKRLRLGAGEKVYEQGESAAHFYIVHKGSLQAVFCASTGEKAVLRSYAAGDQFGYDALLGEKHDTSVWCTSDAELLAVPRELLQRAFSSNDYFQSVWVAPAASAQRLRRSASLSIAGPDDVRRPGVARQNSQKRSPTGDGPAGGVMLAGSVSTPQLPPSEFDALCARGGELRLRRGELAFEQGSLPAAVYLLREGACAVEYTPPAGGGDAKPATRVVGQLHSGDHFGESAVLEGRQVRNSAVRCVDDAGCHLGVLDKVAFLATLRLRPELGELIRGGSAQRQRARLLSVIQGAASSDAVTMRMSAGEPLYRPGDAAEQLFLVDSGCIEILYQADDGRLLPVRRYAKGEIFGASGLLAGDDSRRDTAVAVEPTVVRGVAHSRMRQLMRQDHLLLEGLERASSQGQATDVPPVRTGLSDADNKASGR